MLICDSVRPRVKVTNADGTCVPPPLGPLFPTSPTSVQVSVDVKPQGCPNPINVGALGVLPVAVLGTASFDVSHDRPIIRQATKRASAAFRVRGYSYTVYRDVANATDCTTAGPDGFTDLVLHFDNQTVVAALGPVNDGEIRLLTLTGNLLPQLGGTAIRGQDVVAIIRKK
jgi:hypothetical protein